jgi:hypothetical protein
MTNSSATGIIPRDPIPTVDLMVFIHKASVTGQIDARYHRKQTPLPYRVVYLF